MATRRRDRGYRRRFGALRLLLRRRSARFLGRAAAFGAIIAALILFIAPRGSPDHLARAKAATFELEVVTAFQATVKPEWKTHWPSFAAETGATLFAEQDDTILFYVPAGGGTAFFFARKDLPNDSHVYALTNAHVVDSTAQIGKAKTLSLVIGYLLRSAIWLCPNFTHYDSAPTCATGASADVVFRDPVIDYAVVRFSYLDARVVEGIAFLDLGDERDLRPGDRVLTVGAPVGIEDIVAEGTFLSASVPYFGHPTWRWVVPYDMNTVGGYSGSPVFDPRTGKVVGLHRGALLDPRGSGRSVGLFIPISIVKTALALNGFPVGRVTL